MKRNFLYLSMLLVMLVSPLSAEAASGVLDGRVIIGENFTLRRGEILDGDLLVLGGNVDLEAGSHVQGTVFVMGGNLTSYGEIDGDLGVMGGNVTLEDGSMLHGDILTLGGVLTRRPGAQVEGEAGGGISIPGGLEIPDLVIPEITTVPQFSRAIRQSWTLGPIWQFAGLVMRTLVMGALALLALSFWPAQVERTAQAVVEQPLIVGGLGLLTMIVAPLLLVFLLITIIFSPLSLLGVVLLVVSVVFGTIAVGAEVGSRLARALNWDLQPAIAGALGTLLITFVVGAIGLIDCIGWIAPLVLTAIAIGAVLLTRFGSRVYLGSAAPIAPPGNDSAAE